MILSDFLSRQMHDTSNLHEIIPVSFNIYKMHYMRLITELIQPDRYLDTDAITNKISRSKITRST